MKRLLTAIVLLVLSLRAGASAQVSTNTLILEDDATSLLNLNTITISAPPDNALTSNYALCFPNSAGLGSGSLWFIDGPSYNGNLGPNSFHSGWLSIGNEGEVLTVVSGLPKWSAIPPASLSLSKNALWVGDAGNHASELPAGAMGQILQVNGSGAPSWQTINLMPTGTTVDATLVWNGTQWVENTQVVMNPVSGDIITGGNVTAVEVTTSGNTTVGGDLTVNGTQVNLPTGSIDNSELANSSVGVAYGTGLSGDASVSLGGTLNLQNTGVTSLTGTANQVNVSAPNGAVTLSLPQDIDANATPTFDGITLDNLTTGSTSTNVVVSNGGTLETRTANSLVGASNLTQNNIWVGNATNNPAELATTNVAGAVLQQDGSGAPVWSNNLNVNNVTINNDLVVDNNVTVNGNQVNSGDVTFNGSNFSTSATTTSTFNGPTNLQNTTNVSGDLTINGSTTTVNSPTINIGDAGSTTTFDGSVVFTNAPEIPLTQNNFWMGDASNKAAELAPGTNGQVLQVTGTTPTWQTINLLPAGTTSNTTLVWNGTNWVENTNITLNSSNGDITTTGDVTAVEVTTSGNTTVGGDLTVNGTQVTLPAGSVDNSELANSSVGVAYGAGLSGDASVSLGGTLNLQNTGVTGAAAGTGINVSGATGNVTITNMGVTSLAGTANQVNVSAPNGAVTLTLPQDIDANATPTFDGVTLDNLSTGSTATNVVVSNGGSLETRTVNSLVGASNLTENNLWVGNAANNPAELAPGTNGQVLQVAGTTPTWQTINLLPTGTTSNTTLVWNGTSWVENTNVTLNPTNGDITTAGDVTAVEVTTSGNTTVGGDLTVNGTQVTLPAGSVDNSELANSSVGVAYGTGLSGDASVSLGGTLNLQNTGVTSLAGTANQVNVSAPNGAVTLTLPQDIDANATPTFDGVTLDNLNTGSTATNVVVSNGGSLETRTVNSLVGASNLTENNLWVGNGANNPTELAPGTNGQVLQVTGTTPTWQTINLLPAGTTSNTTLVWNGTSWVENTNVTLNPTNGDITTTGDVTAVEVTTSGNTTVGGDLTVNGTQVTLPAGSVDNSELANSSVGVAYGTGLSGDASVSLGGTLNLQNTGVTSLAGTANQVNVSAPNGAVTLTLPQDIDANATPTFDGVTLDNLSTGSTATNVVVSNGGSLETRTVNSLVGASNLTENNIWVGNGANNPAELAPGTNGQVLQVTGTTPMWQTINLLPAGTTSNTTLVWNGTNWVENTNITLNSSNGDITTTGDVTAVEVTTSGNTTVGGDLMVNGTQVTLPAGSVDNSELANSSVGVAYGAGLSGDASVSLGGTLNLQNTGVTGAAAGTGIDVSGATGNVTITNTGVTSLAGTANQVNVSAPNGAVTLTLPQDIDANATPTFDGVTLDNLSTGSTATNVVVSNGGSLETRTVNSLVGASNLTENNLWVGNASNNPAELAPGTNGQVLRVNGSGAPSWQTVNLMPTGTTSNTTLVWNGTNWVENTNVTLNPTNGDITTTGDVTAVEVTSSGNTTVGGDLTVNGTQVTLPAGSVDNSELANSSVGVAYGAGLSGDASVSLGGTLNLQNTGVTGAAAGTGINVSGATGNVTITNTGVTSLAGTANQVSVSAPNGAVTLTLPQDIDANATPTFDGVTLDNLSTGSTATNVVVSNGGSLETRTVNSLVGASNLTENNLWVGNAANNPAELAPGSNGQILTVVGGTPSWQSAPNALPNGTTTNATLVWNGTAWVENTHVTLDPVTGDVAADGNIAAGGNSIIGGNQSVGGSTTVGGNATVTGNTSIGGSLTVSGGPVNLPAGSVDNSELANSLVNVAYGTGLSGDASVALGGTLNLQNTGVTSISGTSNQVIASASTGGVTLSLPQDIHTAATPTFNRLTLTNMQSSSNAVNIVVSNNGVLETRTISSLPSSGSTSLNHNSMWVGNSSNQATQLGSTGVNGAVLQLNNSGSPSWSNDLNVHNVQISSMLTVNGNQVNSGDVSFNGNNFIVSGGTNSVINGPLTVNGATTLATTLTTNGHATLNSGLTVNGSPVNLPSGSIDNNELANSSVNVSYGSGLSGDGSFSLGGTLHLQNNGVTSISGTSNQVIASASTGGVTLSLPQSIHTGATPTFNRLTLTNMQSSSNAVNIVVSNNGVLETRTISSLPSSGSTSLNNNSMWVGNSSNQATQLGSTGVNGAVLQLNNSGSPSWSNDLNVHNVQISSMLTVNGNQVNSGDVSFNGNNFIVSGGTNSVINGPLTVNGATTLATTLTTNGHATLNSGLTVNGSPVNLPSGSIDNNELANSSVNVSYGSGLSGDGSFSLGGTLHLQNNGVTSINAGSGINVSGNTGSVTITNGGVTSLTGTSNQVNVSSSTGGVTLSLPQSIHTGATPTFNRLTLTNMQSNSSASNIVVSNNGVLETRTLASLGAGSGWGLTGNSGTTDGTNFLGTTDNVAFNIKVNNQRAFRIEPGNTPNLIGGYSGNAVTSNVVGATISGGGVSGNVNNVYDNYGTVGGGRGNAVGNNDGQVSSREYATVGGGYLNTASGTNSTVGGGKQNAASGGTTTVGGGLQNTAQGECDVVAGGVYNDATGGNSTVAGGFNNDATALNSTVGGGNTNRAQGDYSTVAGGGSNTASGTSSFVGGGQNNTASGDYATIAGGRGLTLSGDRSFGFLAGNTGSNNMTISASNVAAIGNADLWMVNNNNSASAVRFYEANSSTGTYPSNANYSSFQAQNQSANIQYKLPDTAGIVGDVLTVSAVSGTNVTLDWGSGSNSGTGVGSVAFARKTANETVSGTTLQNDDDLSIALEANSVYEISGVVYCERVSCNADMDIAWSVPGGTGTGSGNSTMMISYNASVRKNSGNRDVGADIRTSSGTSPSDNAGIIDMASNGLVFIHFKGLVMTGSTSGDITFKWAPTTGGGDQIVVYKNSYMTALRVQ